MIKFNNIYLITVILNMSCCSKKKPATPGPKSMTKEVAVFMDNANDGDYDALVEIYNENVDKVELLSYKNKRAGATALHLAANNGHAEIVQFLVD